MRSKNRIQVIISILFLLFNCVLSYAEIVRKVIEDKKQAIKIKTFYDNNKKIAQLVTDSNDKVIKKEGKIPDGIVKQYYNTGQLEVERNYKNDKLEGIAKAYYETGQLKVERNFKDDKSEGIMKMYFKTGKLQAEYNLENDKREGIAKIYYETGKLKTELNYKNDKSEGIMKGYYETGKLELIENFKDGKSEGISKIYYKTGQLKTENNCKDNKTEGILKVYYKTGKLKAEQNYKDNKRNGLSIIYNHDGITPKQIVTFINDKQIERKIYFNGKLLIQSYTDSYKFENPVRMLLFPLHFVLNALLYVYVHYL